MPAPELTLKSQPPLSFPLTSRNTLTASLLTLTAPQKFTSNIFFAASIGVLSASPETAYPALLNTMSMVPNLERPLANASWMSDSMETSHFRTRSRSEDDDATRSSKSEGLRRVAITLSPLFSAASVMARPKPEDVPVTVVSILVVSKQRGAVDQAPTKPSSGHL